MVHGKNKQSIKPLQKKRYRVQFHCHYHVEGLTTQILKFDIRAYPKFVAAAYLFYQYTFMKNAKKQGEMPLHILSPIPSPTPA